MYQVVKGQRMYYSLAISYSDRRATADRDIYLSCLSSSGDYQSLVLLLFSKGKQFSCRTPSVE